jgi:hypothetical protein
MSTHVEWMDASVGVEVLAPGSKAPDGQEVEHDRWAIALWGDEAVIIEGTLEELRAFVRRLAAVIEAVRSEGA